MNYDQGFGESENVNIGKPINIFRNGKITDGKEFFLAVSWTKDAFLAAAGRQLGLLHPKRIFAIDGVEIDDIISIDDDGTVFISEGEDFCKPKGTGAMCAGYEVKKILGKGGFGEVRLGTHLVTKEKVAMKFMSKATFGNASAAERVVTEIQALTALQHPSVIRMFQVINQVDFVVLVFEFAAGGDLFDYVKDCKMKRLSEMESRSIFRQILAAVAYAHNHNICHGDLKLDNILLANRQVTQKSDLTTGRNDGNNDGEHESVHNLEVKVADFGLSVFLQRGEKSRAVGGSTSYMAPEVWNNQDINGEALDVWCLGCILFSMLCGRLPFDDGTIAEFKIPDDATMITRVNNLDYGYNEEDVSRAAKDCVARQLVVSMKNRATISTLFNHPWMATRRDSEMDVTSLLKGSLASVTHNVAHGEASQQGGERPSLAGLDLIGTKEEIPSALLSTSPPVSTNFFETEGETANIFDNMSPLLQTDGTEKTMPTSTLPRLANDESAAAQAQAKIASITLRSGVVAPMGTGNQDRGHFLKGISKKTSKGSISNPDTLRKMSKKQVTQKTDQVGAAMPTNFNTNGFKLEAGAEQKLTPTPPGSGKKKKFQGGPPRFGRKQTPKQTTKKKL